MKKIIRVVIISFLSLAPLAPPGVSFVFSQENSQTGQQENTQTSKTESGSTTNEQSSTPANQEESPSTPTEKEEKEQAEASKQESEEAARQTTQIETTEDFPATPKEPPRNDPWLNLKGFKDLFASDLFTGEARLTIPFTLPPGRRSLTPELNLVYSSFKKDFVAPYGYGFDLSVSSIFRTSRHGIDQMYVRNDFGVRIGGKSNELALVDAASNLFMGKLGNDMNKYFFENNQWKVQDTEGNTYFFGTDDSSRQDDPVNPSRVFQWMLTKVTDPHGNSIEYTYFKDRNQAYLDKIQYVFTGSGQALYQIDLDYAQKSSSATSYQTGFQVSAYFLVQSINVQENVDSNWVTRRRYVLSYDSLTNPISKLVSITQESEGKTLPALTFEYYTVGPAMGLLKTIKNNVAGEISLEYLPSTTYKDSTGSFNRLPFIVQTLSKSTHKDLVTSTALVKTFTYTGGHYFYDAANVFGREYAGFHEVVSNDTFGTTKTYFHQSQFAPDNTQSSSQGEFDDHISKKGRVYREELYDNQGNLFASTIIKWDKVALGNDRFLTLQKRLAKLTWDGDSSHRDSAEEFEYDQYGRLIKHTAWGEVIANASDGSFTDINSADKVSALFEYAANEQTNMLSFASKKTVLGPDDVNKLRVERSLYDELPLGQIAKGNVTQEQDWLNTNDSYLATTYIYNNQGLVTSKTNPAGYTTTYEYDAPLLYPAKITNSLGHATTYTYDYAHGQPKRITDPNGIIKEHEYDGFGRLVKVLISDLNQAPLLIAKQEIAYNDAITPRLVLSKEFFSEGGLPQETYQYYDGFGRLIQTHTSSDIAGQYSVASLVYDGRGRIQKEYLPYFDASTAYLAPTQPDIQAKIFAYDALDRATSITTAVGKTTNGYSDWILTITDPNNHVKTHYFDAYLRLVRVDEHSEGQIYNTTYEYDSLGDLVKITDAESNMRAFSYDSLGRLASNELPHKLSALPATYVYEYDANGNKTKEVQPDGGVVVWTYDELDRTLTIDDPNSPELEAKYIYDIALYGIGKAAKIVTPLITKEYEYDKQGNLTLEKHTIALLAEEACAPPLSGDWVISEDCALEQNATAPAHVIVQNNATLTIANSASLNIDFATYHLLVKYGSKVIIKQGAKIY